MTVDIYLSDYYSTDGCKFCGEDGVTHGIVGSLKVKPSVNFVSAILEDMEGVEKKVKSKVLRDKLLSVEYLVSTDIQLIRLYNLLTEFPEAEVTILKR